MRKALIAAIVAAALFAVGAFAAEFTVNSEDIASGAGGVGSCADFVEVEYETQENFDTTETDFVITGATVTFLNEVVDADPVVAPDCVGAVADLALLADEWEDSASTTVAADGTATFVVSSVPVRPVVEVAVLANGNKIPNA